MRPRMGDAPPVETAITSGLRSTIEGMMKSQSFGRSATLTRAPAAFAAARARSIRPSPSVAMKQSEQPAKSLCAGSRGAWRKFGLSRSSRNSSPRAGAKTVTSAPARTRSSARRAAATPPPTTIAARPRMSRTIGRSRIIIVQSRRCKRLIRPSLRRRPDRSAARSAAPLAREVDKALDPWRLGRVAEMAEARDKRADHDAVVASVNAGAAPYAIGESVPSGSPSIAA